MFKKIKPNCAGQIGCPKIMSKKYTLGRAFFLHLLAYEFRSP